MREVSWQALEYNVEYYIQSNVKQVMQENEYEDDDLLLPEKLSGMAIGTYERTAKMLGRTSCVFTNVRPIEGAKLPSGIGNRQLEWFANITQYKFYYPEKDNIINRRAIRSFAQYPPTRRLPQSIIDLTKSFIKKESDSLAGSSDSMRVNNASSNAEANRNSNEFPSHYDESDELNRIKVYVAPTYDGISRRAGKKGKKSKGTLKKKKNNKKKK
jgi:hypothetical protein